MFGGMESVERKVAFDVAQIDSGDDVVSKAIIVWTGKDEQPWPDMSDDRIVEQFGTETALDLIPTVNRLAHEFDESDAVHRIRDLSEAADDAAKRFRLLHPELSEESISALRWCYAYRWK